MTDAPDEAVDKLLRAAFTGDNEDVVVAVVESLGGIEVLQVDGHSTGKFEFWLGEPAAFRGSELDNLQAVFEIHEIGVYGDPALAGTTEETTGLEGTFHMIASPDVEDDGG